MTAVATRSPPSPRTTGRTRITVSVAFTADLLATLGDEVLGGLLHDPMHPAGADASADADADA